MPSLCEGFQCIVASSLHFRELILDIIKEGRIVPSEITVELIRKAMEAKNAKRVLIDGFPRCEENRIAFEKIVSSQFVFHHCIALIIEDSLLTYLRPVRLAYKPYFFSQRTVFFSHNKSANSTFSHGLSAKRIGRLLVNKQSNTSYVLKASPRRLGEESFWASGSPNYVVIWRPPSRPRRPPFALGVQGVAMEAAAVALRAGKPARERSISRPAHPASAREGFARWDLKEIGRGFLGKKRDKKGRRDREKKSTAPARFRYPARSRIPPTRRARLVDFHSGRGDWTDSSVLCSSWCPACALLA